MSFVKSYNPSFTSGVAIDSRLVAPGNLFFALKGERTDGHLHLEEVAKREAGAAVVSEAYEGSSFGLNLIRVDDVLAHLQKLAKEALKIPVVGVTGSVGKTTTKEFIATLLKEQFQVASSPENRNSQIGVPLVILNHLTGGEKMLIQEMAMSHAGHIRTLVSIAPPEVAVITNVALVHACNFSSLLDIARAKGEILTRPETKVGILPREMPYFEEIVKQGCCEKVTFSLFDPRAEYYLDADGVVYEYGNKQCRLDNLPGPGVHNRQNALIAIAVARYFGMGWESIANALKKVRLPERRGQQVLRQGILFIDDSYNASEASVKAALAALPLPQNGKTIAVLGEMRELGTFSHQCHENVGQAALKKVDHMLCLGKACQPIVNCFKHAKKPAQLFDDRDALANALKEIAEPGDVVLMKGSNSNQLWRVLDTFV